MGTLATAQYVRTDDLLKESPQLAPYRPEVGICPQLSDAELVSLAVMQALAGFTSEARWVRYVHAHLRHLFPYLPQQPGYNKRLRAAAPLIRHCIRVLTASTTVCTDHVWIVDPTLVECGRSRETARRSDLAGWAEYGYCASHSRYFWGLRLHLVCTLQGLPVAFALTGAKADERDVLLAIFTAEPALVTARPGPARSWSATRITMAATSRLAGQHRDQAAAANPPGRARTRRSAPVQAPAPDHRIGQRHLQKADSTWNATAGTPLKA
jgi:hypothetical protein